MKSWVSVILLIGFSILGWGIGTFLIKAPIKNTIFSAIFALLVIIFIKIEFGLLILLFLNPFSHIVAIFSNYALPSITSEIWNDLLLVFLLVSLISKNIAGRKKFVRGKKLDTAIIIYILYAFALLVLNSKSGIRYEVLSFRLILEPILVYWLTINIIKRRYQIRLYFVFIFISGLILALGAINEIYTYSPKMLELLTNIPSFSYLGYRATMGSDPNIYAYYLDFLIIILFGILMFIPSKFPRYLLLTYIFLLVFSMLLTASRGGIIALMGGITFLVFVLTFIPRFSVSKQKAIVFISILIFLCFGFIVLQKTSEGMFDRITSVRTGSESRIRRLQRYSREIIPEKPFWGFGLSSTVSVKKGSVLRYSELKSGDFGGAFVDAGHTDYLRVVVQMGIIGLVIYLWMLAILIKMSFDLYKTMEKGYYKGLALGIISFYMVFMIGSMTEPLSVSHTTSFVFWFIAGIVQVLHNQYVPKPAPIKHQMSMGNNSCTAEKIVQRGINLPTIF